MARRIDIVSDTHGYLAPELKREIDGRRNAGEFLP